MSYPSPTWLISNGGWGCIFQLKTALISTKKKIKFLFFIFVKPFLKWQKLFYYLTDQKFVSKINFSGMGYRTTGRHWKGQDCVRERGTMPVHGHSWQKLLVTFEVLPRLSPALNSLWCWKIIYQSSSVIFFIAATFGSSSSYESTYPCVECISTFLVGSNKVWPLCWR